MLKLFYLVLIVGFTFSCTKGAGPRGGPQKVLAEYVSRTFAIKEPADKKKLEELTTGEVKGALEKLADDDFRHEFVDAKKDFVSLKIKDERPLGEGKHSITYEITYVNHIHGADDRVTIKKHALFAQEDGKWLISEVRNLKTFIEHENELSF